MHTTFDLIPLKKTFKAPPLEYNNRDKARVTISLFKAKDNKKNILPCFRQSLRQSAILGLLVTTEQHI